MVMEKKIDDGDKVLIKLLKGQSALDHYNARMKEIWDKVVLDKKGIEVKCAKVEVEDRGERSEDDGKPLPEEEVRDFMRRLGIDDRKYRIECAITEWSSWIKWLKSKGKYERIAKGRMETISEGTFTKNRIRGLKMIEVYNQVFGDGPIAYGELNLRFNGEVGRKLDQLVDRDKITEAVEYLKDVIASKDYTEDMRYDALRGQLQMLIDEKVRDLTEEMKIDEAIEFRRLEKKIANHVVELKKNGKLGEANEFLIKAIEGVRGETQLEVEEAKMPKDIEKKLKEITRTDIGFWEGLVYFIGAGLFVGMCVNIIYQICKVTFKAIGG
jgi:hypothetical protein